jgi:hypothetical protein
VETDKLKALTTGETLVFPDRAMMAASGFDENLDLPEQLLVMNLGMAVREKPGKPLQPPGLPGYYPDIVSNMGQETKLLKSPASRSC